MPALAPEQAAATTDPIVREALRRFKYCEEYNAKVREQAAQCHEFFVGGDMQWQQKTLSSYRAQNRPHLTFNQLPQFVYNVLNEQLQNPAEIQVSPFANGAQEKIARVYQDIIRQIRNSRNGQFAINHAHRDHIVGGFGFFRICTCYCSDRSWNQCIYLEPIDSCFSVAFDPGATYPTYSDANYCFVFHDLTREEFEYQYPDARLTSIAGIDGNENEWVQKDSIRIAEYLKVEKKARTLVLLRDGRTVFENELNPLTDLPATDQTGEALTREREERIVWCYKLSAYEQLSPRQRWVGSSIPIIPVLGEKVIVNGDHYLKGLLHDALDPATASNFMQNAQIENIALGTKAPWLVEEGQIENYETDWAWANIKANAYLKYRRYDAEGRDLGAPIRNNMEPPVQAVQVAINSHNLSLQQSMGIYPNALGQTQALDESARAVIERKKQSSFNNVRFSDNLNRALEYCGEQLLELIPKVLDALQVMELEGLDRKRYRVAVYNSQTQGQMTQDALTLEGIRGVFDLSRGDYTVSISSGPSYETQRAETMAFYEAFASAVPQLVPRFADLWARSMDFPEKDELADRLTPPDIALQAKQPATQLPALQTQLQQSQQMVLHLSQMVQQLTQEKQAKATEIQGRMAIEAMKQRGEDRRQQSKSVTDLAIQASEARQADAGRLLEHEIGRIESNLDREHEAHMAIFQRPPGVPPAAPVDQQQPMPPS